jgi:hypothetical protein
MPANNTGAVVRELAARFPDRLGHLFSPGGERMPFAPVALDNGVFAEGENWTADGWLNLLDWIKAKRITPEWALVPDVVGDREATLERWRTFEQVAYRYGWPLAFAVQDGMTPDDVPWSAEVVFIGGSTTWKWRTMASWCARFPRVHVGRVNSYRRLWQCHDAGAESCDGTGWMRGDQVQYRGLIAYLEESAGMKQRAEQLGLVMA